MANYLIHTCNARFWYVKEYLIPSMTNQGIKNIKVWLDEKNEGNLKSCIKSFQSLPNTGGTWHLQDDVLISSNFKAITEAEDRGIRCGFASRYDTSEPGRVYVKDMWYSFPCIRLPNPLASSFADWLETNKRKYADYIKTNKHDDTLFHMYLEQEYPKLQAVNIAPNLVEHIDWLIGGSQTHGSNRIEPVRAKYWEEEQLVQDLKILQQTRKCRAKFHTHH